MIVPIEGGEAKEIVHIFVGITSMDVSRDSQRVAFQTSDPKNRFKLVVCDLPTCANRITVDPPSNFAYSATRFTPDGRAVAYVDSSGSNIWALPLDGSAPRQITHFAGDRRIESFAWSRDGKRLAMMWGTRTDDIVLLKGLRK